MATIIRIPRKSGARAPQNISGINWASPLARGLVAGTVFDASVRNLADGSSFTRAGDTSLVAHQLQRVSVEVGTTTGAAGAGRITAPQSLTDAMATDVLTVAYWASVPVLSNNGGLLYRSNNGNSEGWKLLCDRASSLMRVRHPQLTPSNLDWTSFAPAIDEPYLVAFTYDGTTRRIYYNGEEVASDSPTGTVTYPSNDFIVGYDPGFFNFNRATQYISLAAWNRALSASEVRALYNPATRWDIYNQDTRTISLPAAAPPAGGIIPRFYHNRFRNRAV